MDVDLRTVNDVNLGRLSVRQNRPFDTMAVMLEPASFPTDLLLAWAYGIFWDLEMGSSSGKDID